MTIKTLAATAAILSASCVARADEAPVADFATTKAPHYEVRGGLKNAQLRIAKEKAARVAFVGGSITEGNGWRPLVCEGLSKRYPETKFDFSNAGISSTCSTTGVHRLQTDVFSKGRVDLLFVEFAVNDNQDAGHDHATCIRGMEGILCQARKHNPNIDVIFVYFPNAGHIKTINEGAMPHEIVAHEKVAAHYRVPVVNVAADIALRIKSGESSWQVYGGTHPKPAGSKMVADRISELFDVAWDSAPTQLIDHPAPTAQLDPLSYTRGRFLPLEKAKLGDGWTIDQPNWKAIKGGKRGRFTAIPMLTASEPGSTLSLPFRGSAIGVYVVAGPDAGTMEFSIDGEVFKSADLFHRFSRGLHYPRTVTFAADLKPTDHTLTLRVAEGKNKSSSGTAIRIMQFTAN